jgi:hypothetical protein
VADGTNQINVAGADVRALAARHDNGADNIYFYDHTDAGFGAGSFKTVMAPGVPVANQVVNLGTVAGGPFAGPITQMAVDAGGDIYFIDNGSVWKVLGTDTSTATKIIDQVDVNVANLAVDTFGNIYYGTTTDLYKAVLTSAAARTGYTGTTGGAAIVTGLAAITELEADAAGNIYFLAGGAVAGNLKMRAANNGTTVYTVKATEAITVQRVAVSPKGKLFYTVNGTNALSSL